MTPEEKEEWQERLKAAVAETLRKRAAKKAERLEFQRRRNYGLTQRHAAKLARIRKSTGPSTDTPPTKEN